VKKEIMKGGSRFHTGSAFFDELFWEKNGKNVILKAEMF